MQDFLEDGNKHRGFSSLAWDFIKDAIQVIVLALILTFVLRHYVVEAREIPSGSMLPTLEIGDRLLVDKIVFKFDEFERTDIVVFAPPPEAQIGDMKNDLIKRIIGLPGDTVEVRDGKVLINGESLEEPYIAQKPSYNIGPITIPEGAVFVMGDNRNNSFDSHSWGFLPIENIKGRAFWRFWPLNRTGLLAR
ncbi:MAG: signal peptidase I [Firmicutes bacterium HGW-Firmicutes-14]|nr:MAG: signal peptidase I [Firmicutes bacterium HGW-Firmicutes-14]